MKSFLQSGPLKQTWKKKMMDATTAGTHLNRLRHRGSHVSFRTLRKTNKPDTTLNGTAVGSTEVYEEVLVSESMKIEGFWPTVDLSPYKNALREAQKVMKESGVMVTKPIKLNSALSPEQRREEIRAYFHKTYDCFESLYRTAPGMSQEEGTYTRGDALRHPPNWYLGHTAGFYINKLRIFGVLDKPVDAAFESLFAVGVDEMSWDDKLETRTNWPHVGAVMEYRDKVRAVVDGVISSLPPPSGLIRWRDPWYLIVMGIEHDRIHLETSSVLLRQLPLEMMEENGPWANVCPLGIFDSSPSYTPALGEPGHAPANELVPVKGGRAVLGRPRDDEAMAVYGWDNEYGESEMDVPDFKASKFLVSNEEFWEAVQDGLYKNERFWTKEGWSWVQRMQPEHPRFWVRQPDGGFTLRNMAGEVALPWDWPCVTNQLEGEAFCNWKGEKLGRPLRLPTEDEWQVMRADGELNRLENTDWTEAPGNTNLEYYASETPVNLFPSADTGLYDVLGNVWQHTMTPQHPFPGFEPHVAYDDFTVPCFGPHHNIIKGGSWISTGNEAMRFSRYQFRRHFYQHAGIRYVESERDLAFLQPFRKPLITKEHGHIQLYAHLHYSDEECFGLSNFPKRVAEIAIRNTDPSRRGRAMDVGCNVGRTTFELARAFQSVLGVDRTTRLLGVCYRVKEIGLCDYALPIEGDIEEPRAINVDSIGLTEAVRDRTDFQQEDAQNMRRERLRLQDGTIEDYDCVVVSNVIEELGTPHRLLKDLQSRVSQGGTLVLLSQYEWKEDRTDKSNWVGGIVEDDGGFDVEVRTLDRMKAILGEHFEFVSSEDVPWVLRLSERKLEYNVSECSVWKRR